MMAFISRFSLLMITPSCRVSPVFSALRYLLARTACRGVVAALFPPADFILLLLMLADSFHASSSSSSPLLQTRAFLLPSVTAFLRHEARWFAASHA